jgi:hypothetical protein
MSEESGMVSEYASSADAAGIRVWIDKETTEDYMNEYAKVVIAEDGARIESLNYVLEVGEESFDFAFKHFAAVPSKGGSTFHHRVEDGSKFTWLE